MATILNVPFENHLTYKIDRLFETRREFTLKPQVTQQIQSLVSQGLVKRKY